MSDYVERLRDALDGEPKLAPDPDDVLEAVDEITRLRAENERLRAGPQWTDATPVEEVTRLRARVEELEEALEPFADLADTWDDDLREDEPIGTHPWKGSAEAADFTIADLRRARALRGET